MASVINDPNGRKRIQFVAPDGSRKAIRLGKIDRKGADSICRHVEALLSAKISGQPVSRETATWLSEIGSDLREKLANVGIVDASENVTLGAFLDRFISNRKPSAAANTITNLEQAKKRLVGYFGRERAMASITVTEADTWAAGLMERYAPATAGRTIKRARQFFKAAIREKVVAENPFADVKASGQANRERQFHVSREVIERVIEAAPDAEWRLIIALSRYGGLRCPSEHLALKWTDVNWERTRFRVASPKTGERWIPIFPELRPYLEECFDLAAEGATDVITRYRDTNANLRTTFMKIIRRAGEKPWPKLFHNLRASRETELAAEHPIHVVCAWIGNSAAIAAKHYLTVREEDYLRGSGAKSGARVAQKQAQQADAERSKNPKKSTKLASGEEVTRNLAASCNYKQNDSLPLLGLELEAKIQENTMPSGWGGAENGALGVMTPIVDSSLAMVIEAWPKLPEVIRNGIVAMVRAARG